MGIHRQSRRKCPAISIARAVNRCRPPRPEQFGVVTGSLANYNTSPTGANNFRDVSSPLTGLAQTFRLLTPGPAWTAMSIRYHSQGSVHTLRVSGVKPVRGTYTTNVRGELAGKLGSVGLVSRPVSPWFTFSGDLVRPDGLMGLVVGPSLPGHGELLAISMDQRQSWWVPWSPASLTHEISGPKPAPRFVVSTVPMIQYVLRTILPSVILAMGLALLAFPAFAISFLLVRGVTRLTAGLNRSGVASPAHRILRPRTADAAAVGIVAAGAMAMAWMASYDFQRVPTTQDNVVYLFMARTFGEGRLWAPVPHPLIFFSQFAMLHLDGHWFGKYPPGWPLLLAAGAVINASWIVSPLISALGLGLMYLIGREFFGRKVALLAVVIGLASPFMLFLGSGYYPEPVMWLFLGSFVYLSLVWLRRHGAPENQPWQWHPRTSGLLIAAGFAAGMGVLTRPLDAVAFGLPFLASLFWRRPPAFCGWRPVPPCLSSCSSRTARLLRDSGF